MSGGYAMIYQKRKSINHKDSIVDLEAQPEPEKLTKTQLAINNWLVDRSLIPFIQGPSKAQFIETICSRGFSSLFRISRLFGISILPPLNNNPDQVSEKLRQLLLALDGKKLLEPGVTPELVAKRDEASIFALLSRLYQIAMSGISAEPHKSKLEEVSNWLIDLGIDPPFGTFWFSYPHSLYPTEDPLKNGELFRRLCVVFRPDLFEVPPPPASSTREMIERTRQAMLILVDDGILGVNDINEAESIVKGKPNSSYSMLARIMEEYKLRLRKKAKLLKGQ